MEPAQYPLWAPSVLTTLTKLANVPEPWQLQQIKPSATTTTTTITPGSLTGGRKLAGHLLLTVDLPVPIAGVGNGNEGGGGSPTRQLLQQQQSTEVPDTASQSSQTTGQTPAPAQLPGPATATISSRVVYSMNTTSYTLVAWRLSQPVVKGSSKFGCLNELCEELAASGVPVIPGSIVVEPDGLGGWG